MTTEISDTFARPCLTCGKTVHVIKGKEQPHEHQTFPDGSSPAAFAWWEGWQYATDARGRVLNDVAKERRNQIAKGYTPEHDDRHDTHTLVQLAERRAHMVGDRGHGLYDRHRLVQAAALLVAAAEAMDRREGQE